MRRSCRGSPRRVPARRIAANDEPYSTSRCSPRWYQTRCGISCTSGYAPVTIDDRQTGVSDGNTVAARRYSPARASSASAGAVRRSTASSYIAGVSPSMTIRSALVAGKDPQAGVALACAPADAQAEHGQRERDEVAERPERRRARPATSAATPTSSAVPPRVPPRAQRAANESAPRRRRRARRRSRRRPPRPVGESQPDAPPRRRRATAQRDSRGRASTPTARTPSAAPRPARRRSSTRFPRRFRVY